MTCVAMTIIIPFHLCCGECGEEFKEKRQLTIHIDTEHPMNTNVSFYFCCGECGKEFKGRRELTIHFDAKHPSQHFECEVCFKICLGKSIS